ncbi:MAG: hypothetical protein NWS20_03590 [Rickettsiaceae bacterium]|nr:hypothetical protein [Rickettsiaceae bacterium]MDP4832398.1 hypothetical protein [Rickettsiaceae bacterium]MDP5020127.1 hypothetical protein [Rickettsiaceae bacterium]MDP5082775.1 hypothetical protein [Rickettsiaceae bacterium]
MPKNVALSQAMSARLCHDLAGSIGTIDNCLGLFEHDDETIAQKAKSLASEESNNLVNQIKFFRNAYGISDGESSMSLINMTKLLNDFFKSTQVQLNLHFETGLIYIEAHLAKSAMCLAAIVSENISYSGVIDFYLNKDQYNPLRLLGNGANIILKNERLEILQGAPRKAINVSNCREHYVSKMCVKTGYQVMAQKKTGAIEYKILKKQ